ncbi:MAG: putative transcriptional regulatory protein [Naasia sp.]|jgi:AcrR family transcriptional regulator|uniref:TetR/AcrR family transcriptional regulator n=1 Tax=Naasia sp. TaxID=2546198 RepID=UPI002613D5A9|nr:TetR/AcrR family transcriptional regulator [Naasia sp.]MCU1569369.1 putative transcriptional regulatory protein [Naasia sp.]
MASDRQTAPAGETRERILIEASRLFALRGFYGTSTRDIAEAVGVRQPSLFYHFPAKHLILSELVDRDVSSSIAQAEAALALDASWAERFHFFLLSDSTIFLGQPFDARGLYQPAVFVEPEFARQRATIDRFHRLTTELVAGGSAAGEFIPVDAGFVQRAQAGITFEGMRERGPAPSSSFAHRPLQTADFVVRAVLVDPSRLESVRAASLRRLESAGLASGVLR